MPLTVGQLPLRKTMILQSLAQLYAMDGTELRLANIALTESNGDLAKDGYCYNSNTKVITLENVLVSAIDQLPSGDITIKIKGTVVFECAINAAENTNKILITDDNDKNAKLIMVKARNITVLSAQEIENGARGEINTYNSGLNIGKYHCSNRNNFRWRQPEINYQKCRYHCC